MATMSQTETVRWGILSTARIATKIAEAIGASDGAEVSAIASRSLERAEFWAREHGVPRTCADYQALLDDDQLDAIYVPLPPSMHAEWTIRCAEAGKHVLCEKPLAMNVTEAEEMAAACRENNVQLMDATMWVHHPRTADMFQPIADGTLGELRRVTSAFSFDLEPYLETNPPHAAIDPQTGQTRSELVAANEFRLQRDMGGGALMDLGWYNVRVALWAMGELPREVFAKARYRNDVDINMNALMWYDDNRTVAFDCGYDLGRRKWFEVVGTKSSLVCDDFLSPWDPDRPRFWTHDEAGQSHEHVSAADIQEVCMIERFCQIVRSGELDESWPQISVAAQRVCDAVNESARSGQVVEIEDAA